MARFTLILDKHHEGSDLEPAPEPAKSHGRFRISGQLVSHHRQSLSLINTKTTMNPSSGRISMIVHMRAWDRMAEQGEDASSEQGREWNEIENKQINLHK